MLRVPVSHVLNLVVLAFLLVSYLCSLESGARCGMSSERRTHPCSRRWRYRTDRTASDDGVMRFRSQVEALGEDVQKLLETLTKTPAMIKIKRSLDEMACLRTLDATSGPNADDKHEPTPIERPTETKAELEEEEDAAGLLALEAPVGFIVTVTSSNCCCDHCDQSNLWRIVAQHDSSSCSVLVSISQLQLCNPSGYAGALHATSRANASCDAPDSS